MTAQLFCVGCGGEIDAARGSYARKYGLTCTCMTPKVGCWRLAPWDAWYESQIFFGASHVRALRPEDHDVAPLHESALDVTLPERAMLRAVVVRYGRYGAIIYVDDSRRAHLDDSLQTISALVAWAEAIA